MKRIKIGILIVSMFALLVMGWMLYEWIGYFSWDTGLQVVSYGSGGIWFLNLVTGIPLVLLAGLSATINAARSRRREWLIALLLLLVLGTVAVIYTWFNPYYFGVPNVGATHQLPPLGLDYTPWLPLVIPVATLIYSFLPASPAKSQRAAPRASNP